MATTAWIIVLDDVLAQASGNRLTLEVHDQLLLLEDVVAGELVVNDVIMVAYTSIVVNGTVTGDSWVVGERIHR